MRSSLCLLAAVLVMGSVSLAQPRRRPIPPVNRVRDAAVVDVPRDATADVLVDGASDAGTTRSGPTCCCRAWSHGWQYAWRTESECGTQNGSCVSPDHC